MQAKSRVGVRGKIPLMRTHEPCVRTSQVNSPHGVTHSSLIQLRMAFVSISAHSCFKKRYAPIHGEILCENSHAKAQRARSNMFLCSYVKKICVFCVSKKEALCHNEQTAALLLNFGLGHVLQYTPVILNFSALHFTHSYTTQEGVPKFCISTHPLSPI